MKYAKYANPVRFVLGLFFLTTPYTAQTQIRVPADQPTIQAAIAAATDGDTVLVSPGTYVEQLDFLGKEITVRSRLGPMRTTIDSQGMNMWMDFPRHAVVRMVNGEGPGTRLEGFSITGADDFTNSGGAAGVFCVGLSPRIVNCRVFGIVGGPGIWGDAVIEDCAVTGNSNMPYGDGGGVSGAAAIRRSTISGNRSGGLGGGVYLSSAAPIEDCLIQDNIAGNGADGYSGGGVFGPATLERSVITGNSAHHWLSGGPLDEIGSGVDGAVSIDRCTIAFNEIVNSSGFAVQPGGGVCNVPTITNSIVWGNEDAEFSASTAPNVTYSIIQGGYPGTGNLTGDPLFVDAAAGNYCLQTGSPAIDAGDPAAALDPDGTRADMGGLYSSQLAASTSVRNGAGLNPVCFASTTQPVLGATWTTTVDATAHGFGGTMTRVLVYVTPAAISTSLGELLVDPTSPRLVASTAVVAAGVGTHSVPVPGDACLAGLTATSQAFVLGGGFGMCNALDLTLGQ